MVVKPKIRGFICTTAHKVGCLENVNNQINYVKSNGKIDGCKNVLIIGGSAGFGLASRIVSAFGCGANTLSISFDKEAANGRLGSAGYYNSSAFDKLAKENGLYSKTIYGDAFSKESKETIAKTIKEDMGKVDLIIYSLAAPRRVDHEGNMYSSVLKCIGQTYKNNTINLKDNTIEEVEITDATEEEIQNTVKVMGGEDWKLWVDYLKSQDCLEQNAITVAYSYIGPQLTHPIYLNGSIGKAKEDLQKTADLITNENQDLGIKGYISVNKALVTQASAAIPIVPLYITVLYKIMKEKGLHEGCIEQIDRLFREKLYVETPQLDEKGRLRIDDYEMREDVQLEVSDVWEKINSDNLKEYADIDGYWQDFYSQFGFGIEGVNYDEDIDIS